MSDATTKKMIQAFLQSAAPTGFMAGLFDVRPGNFHNSEYVEIDIMRETEYLALPVIDGNGYRIKTLDEFTNKQFKPPQYKTATPIRADDLYSREWGQNTFADQEFQAKLTAKAIRAGGSLIGGYQRALELQAAQVMQTGIVDLKDANGVTLFSLDFGLAATHKITAGTAWDQAGGDPIGDIDAACQVVRADGKLDANQVIMATDAFEAAVANSDFQARFDNRRIDLGAINPMPGEGGTGGGNYRGTIDVGNYKVDLWTYGGQYTDPQTGNNVDYLTSGNVIVRSSMQRLDFTSGSIPLVVPPDRRVARYLPRRVSSVDRRIDLFTNVWADNSGETLNVGVGGRPLMIPTQIDGYAVVSGTVTP